MSRKMLSLALLAAVGLPLVVGCQFLLLRICVKNDTPYFLDEFTVKASGDLTYPDGDLKNLPPGPPVRCAAYPQARMTFGHNSTWLTKASAKTR